MANIKECFKSRWGDNGVIVEIDFSQLEVIGAATVSGDPMMKADIMNDIDSHSQSASWLNPQHTYDEIRAGYVNDDPFFTEMRKKAKAPRFELQYGARAPSIARNNKISLEKAQGFIDAYYDRYKVLKAFQEDVQEQVEASIRLSDRRTASGQPAGVGEYISITGRRYSFYEQDSPQWLADKGQPRSISPTQIANYPMQGFATGDIVPEVLGRVHDYIADRDLYEQVLMINTVHDSIIFDVHRDKAYEMNNIAKYMENVPAFMNERFGITIDLPFKVDVEYGRNWGNMKSNYQDTL
jgi:DNA polymerase I-like protein with 3'-5' exonuclease and polymerase domains